MADWQKLKAYVTGYIAYLERRIKANTHNAKFEIDMINNKVQELGKKGLIETGHPDLEYLERFFVQKNVVPEYLRDATCLSDAVSLLVQSWYRQVVLENPLFAERDGIYYILEPNYDQFLVTTRKPGQQPNAGQMKKCNTYGEAVNYFLQLVEGANNG